MPNLVSEQNQPRTNVLNQNPTTASATRPDRNEDLEMSALDSIEEFRKFLLHAREVHKQNIKLTERNKLQKKKIADLQAEIAKLKAEKG